MLNNIKTLKRYCKATLNMFLIKKIYDDDKIFYLYDRFFESNRNFTTEHVKIIKIPGFSGFLVIFVQNFRFFQIFFA